MKKICLKCKESVYLIWYFKKGYWCLICMQYSKKEEVKDEKE